MHGMVLGEFKKYVETTYPKDTWVNLLRQTTGFKTYYALEIYPDEEMFNLLKILAQLSGKTVSTIHKEFGCYITPSLIKNYGFLINPKWQTLDLIENTQEIFHVTVERRHNAQPPHLISQRLCPSKLLITYSSTRRMCGFAEGIVERIATHFGEKIQIIHETCMLKNSDHCELLLEKRNFQIPSIATTKDVPKYNGSQFCNRI